MKIAVSGSHCTGKSTLIAAFCARSPGYAHEPEAYELLADEITLLPGEGPDLDGLLRLIQHTIAVIESYPRGVSVVFERSPIDYLAHAAASESMAATERDDFLDRYIPTVRTAIRHLDLIVLLPVSSAGPIQARPGEDVAFRERVDAALRGALVDDDHDLFSAPDAPRVVELPPGPEQYLGHLLRLTHEGASAP